MAWARDHVVLLPDGFRMFVSAFSYVENEVASGRFELNRVKLFHTLLSDQRRFVDIGANIGFFSLLAASKGCVVDAFEPAKVNYRRLCGNSSLNKFGEKIGTHQIALGECKATSNLFAPLNDNYGRISLRSEVGTKIGRINVDTLDAVLPVPDTPVTIKIDVEGFEENVLKGSQRWIESTASGSAWVVEIHVGIGVKYETIADYFKGYTITYFSDQDGTETILPTSETGDVVLVARKR